MNYKIWLSSPHLSDEHYEMEYIKEAIDTNWIAPLGPNVANFENEVKEYLSADNCLALSTGTAAIHMAIKASGVKQGDYVICQSFTFSASANPIIYEGAFPIFIDSSESNWTIDIHLLEKALNDYKNKVKAVIIVHIYGLPCQMDEILNLCRRHNVILIEDAAESIGSRYKNRHTGTIGQFGIISFNGNKIITTSSGGILISKDKKILDKVLFWSTQSRDNALHYQHSELGYNYRMSNVLAGIGRGQIKVLEQRIILKKKIYHYYMSHLSDLQGIKFMPIHDWQQPNYWLTCIITNEFTSNVDIIDALAAEHIQSRPLWKPLHMQPFFLTYPAYNNGVSQFLFENGLCLPSDSKITEEELLLVCSIVRSTWKIK
jgi:dTDP-4-amino-4,6-dideoxygalactose transaminase